MTVYRTRTGLVAVLAIVATLSGCAMQRGMHRPPLPQMAENCPAIGAGHFEAWLDAMPGPGGSHASLNISGKVDLPTPGYRLELAAGPADRMMPPSQRFRLVAWPPPGMAAQVVTTSEVHYRAPAQYPAYRSLIILCGERVLATITHIPVVH